MYQHFFGLTELPFSLTPDTEFFFNYKEHQEALNVLLVALRSGEGFLKITGEVGTGKTLLCRQLLNTVGPEFVTAYIPNPFLEPDALRGALAEELGIEVPSGVDQHTLVRLINEKLIELVGTGKHVVLCLDEAQAMPDESLEALRLLTNLETEKSKLLQVVLFGQPELDKRLGCASLRQLRQRITFSYYLHAMDRDGVGGYIQHRLSVAGYNGGCLFKPRAIKTLYRASGGVPRLINILSHKALMAAFGQGAHAVSEQHVRMAARDTDGVNATRKVRIPFLYAMFALVAFTGGMALLGGVVT